MHFDHDNGTISSLLTIDTTIQPILGGETGILNIVGTGGLKLPSGPTSSRGSSIAGLIRFNEDTTGVEYFSGSSWITLGSGGSGSQQVFVQTTQPSVPPGTQYIWVQTGLGLDGQGLTFWVDDGL